MNRAPGFRNFKMLKFFSDAGEKKEKGEEGKCLSNYKFGKQLGKGAYGNIFSACKIKKDENSNLSDCDPDISADLDGNNNFATKVSKMDEPGDTISGMIGSSIVKALQDESWIDYNGKEQDLVPRFVDARICGGNLYTTFDKWDGDMRSLGQEQLQEVLDHFALLDEERKDLLKCVYLYTKEQMYDMFEIAKRLDDIGVVHGDLNPTQYLFIYPTTASATKLDSAAKFKSTTETFVPTSPSTSSLKSLIQPTLVDEKNSVSRKRKYSDRDDLYGHYDSNHYDSDDDDHYDDDHYDDKQEEEKKEKDDKDLLLFRKGIKICVTDFDLVNTFGWTSTTNKIDCPNPFDPANGYTANVPSTLYPYFNQWQLSSYFQFYQAYIFDVENESLIKFGGLKGIPDPWKRELREFCPSYKFPANSSSTDTKRAKEFSISSVRGYNQEEEKPEKVPITRSYLSILFYYLKNGSISEDEYDDILTKYILNN